MYKKGCLRDMLNKQRLIRIVGAHNGLTARLVQEAGFDGVWASGLEISTSHAVPDANILTMSDFLDAASSMVSAVSIPVIADCDTGFGNSNNVMHMVRKYEAAGVSAVCIEDKKFPKVNSFISGRQELAPIAEFVGKLMAAKNAQITEEFMVLARTEALIAGCGQHEALRRAEAYLGAGADGIFIHSKLKTPQEIIDFCKVWKRRCPIIVCPTTYSFSESQMQELGISIVIYANHGIRAAIKHIKEVFNYIREEGASGLQDKIATMDEVFRLQGMHLMKNNEKKYLKTDAGSLKAIIPAAGAKMDGTLKLLLEDRPVAMLDINGKSLLQRNVEALNLTGIRDIYVIVGYKADKIVCEGINIIENTQFETKGIMHSIIQGVSRIAEKNLILYSDILLDQYLLEKLVKKEGDIILVVDSTYKKTHFRNKELELVVTKNPSADKARSIDINIKNPICRIGKNLPQEDSHSEFIGVALLSKKGMEIIAKEYENAGLPEPVSFVDIVQCLADKGQEILAHEVRSGWMELHNFDDYKSACSVFSLTNL